PARCVWSAKQRGKRAATAPRHDLNSIPSQLARTLLTIPGIADDPRRPYGKGRNMSRTRNRTALAGALALAIASGAASAEPRIVSVVTLDDLGAFVVLGEDLQYSAARSRITL